MQLTRRGLMKGALGTAAVGTGYVAKEELTKGTWLYDPATLTAARNRFFGLADVKTLYELQQEYGNQSVETAQFAGQELSPDEISRVASVGSVSVSGDNGVPTGVTSAAVTGSFDAETISDPVDSSQRFDEVGPYAGYTLWEADVAGGAAAGGDATGGQPTPSISPSMLRPDTTALGVRKGTAVTGTVRAPEAKTTSVDAVKTMISARNSGLRDPAYLADVDKFSSIRRQFGPNPTFLYGILIDPALVTLTVAYYEVLLGFIGGFAGPFAGFTDMISVILEQWFESLRGGAIGAKVDRDAGTTTVKLFLTYSWPDAAKQTGIVQFFNALANSAEPAGLKEVDARYRGENVVVRMKADTEAVFDSSVSGTGGPTGTAGPTGTDEQV